MLVDIFKQIPKDLLVLFGGILAGVIVTAFKNYIFSFVKLIFVNKVKDATTGEQTPTEKFSFSKLFSGMLNIVNPVAWAKDFQSIFNLRKLVIVGIILSVLYGFGFWKGGQGKPVYLDLQGKEEYIKLNEHFLHILPDGSMDVLHSDKKTVLKKVTIKDVDGLKKALRPYGLQFKPIGVLGVGGGGTTGIKVEGGGGVSFAKWMDWQADAFITNQGAYLGTSYNLGKLKLYNTSVGVAGGRGWKGDTRILFYGAIKL